MISGGWSGSTSASVLLWPVPSRRRDWLVYRATGRDSGIYTVHVCMYSAGNCIAMCISM